TVPPGKSVAQVVTEERTITVPQGFSGFDEVMLRKYLAARAISQPVQDALKKVLEQRAKIAETQEQISRLEASLKAIADDQTRLRANLREMPNTSAAYKRYLEKFDKQETEIEKLQGQDKELKEGLK